MVRATSRESVSTHMDKHTREMQVNAQYWVEMGGIVHFRAQRTHHPYTTVAMPEEGNKRYSNILEPYKINHCQQKGDCVKVETASTRV